MHLQFTCMVQNIHSELPVSGFPTTGRQFMLSSYHGVTKENYKGDFCLQLASTQIWCTCRKNVVHMSRQLYNGVTFHHPAPRPLPNLQGCAGWKLNFWQRTLKSEHYIRGTVKNTHYHLGKNPECGVFCIKLFFITRLLSIVSPRLSQWNHHGDEAQRAEARQ